MTPDQARAMYRRQIANGEEIQVRRYSGTGANRPKHDTDVRARVTGYAPEQLVGGIQQGDRRVIILAQDLIDKQFALPIVIATDKVVVRGKELAIVPVDDNTRRLAGELIAIELTARG